METEEPTNEPLNLMNIIEVQHIFKRLKQDEVRIFNYIIACANDRINSEGLLPDELPDEVEEYFSPNLSDHSSDLDTDEELDYAKDYANYKDNFNK
jgi:hypothetical protein